MKSDGPILLAVLFLACGLTLIFAYGHGTAGASAAYPVSAANVNLSIATTGPAAIGGLGLLTLGLIVLAWALLCAIVGLFRRDDPEARLERMESRRLAHEEKLDRVERKRTERQDRMLEREGRRLHVAVVPKE
jgi:hypothetical protein